MNIKTYKNCYNLRKGLNIESEEISLFALKNEKISFQILVISNGEEIQVSDFSLKGENSEQFKCFVFAMDYLECKKPPNQLIEGGVYPDAILPFDIAKSNKKNIVDCNDERGFLIQITPDIAMQAGKYELRLEIFVNNDKKEIPLQVEVFDAVMPTKNNCKTLFGIFKDCGWLGDDESKWAETYKKYYDMLVDYRLSAAYLPTKNIVIDKAPIEDVVETVMQYANDDRISCYALNYQVKRVEVDGKSVAQFDYEYFKNLLIALCNHSTNENNLLKKCVLSPGSFIDEPTPDKHQQVRNFYDGIYKLKRDIANELDFSSKREVEASLLTFDVIITMWNKEGVYGGVDTFCPQYEAFSYPEYVYESSKLRQLGFKEWFYGCMGPQNPYPNYLTYDKFHQIKIVNWMMFDYNINGNLYFAVNLTYNSGKHQKKYINMMEDKHFTAIKVNDEMISYYGDGCLIYNEIFYGELVPTLRLNAIMEGNEDYEKLLLYKTAIDNLSKKYCAELDCKNILKPHLDKLYDGAATTNYEENLLTAEYALNILLELARQGVYLERKVIDNQVEMTVFYPKDIEFSSSCKMSSCIEKQNCKIGKFLVETNKPKNYFEFTLNGKEYSVYVADLLMSLDKSLLSAHGRKIEYSDYNDVKLVETKAFLNTEKEEVQLKYTLPFDAEKLDRLYIDVTSLSDFSFCISVDLIDDEGKVFALGYDVVEEKATKTISLKKQMRLIKRLNDYFGFDRAYECKQKYVDHFNIHFNKIKCIQFTVLNNLKFLDDNRERRMIDYKFLINNIYYSVNDEKDV